MVRLEPAENEYLKKVENELWYFTLGLIKVSSKNPMLQYFDFNVEHNILGYHSTEGFFKCKPFDSKIHKFQENFAVMIKDKKHEFLNPVFASIKDATETSILNPNLKTKLLSENFFDLIIGILNEFDLNTEKICKYNEYSYFKDIHYESPEFRRIKELIY
jgi:hypothetical protein